MTIDNLVAEYGEKLYNLAARITGNREEAHDVVQDTFLTWLEKGDQFRGDSSLYTWLYRVAVNRSLQYKRVIPAEQLSQQRAMMDYTDSRLPEELREWEDNPEKELFLKELEADVRAECHHFMLFILTPEQRITFLLRTIAHLSYREIGEVLDIDENSVKSRMNRIKKRIENDFHSHCRHYSENGDCSCRASLKYVVKSYPQILGKISGNSHYIEEIEAAFRHADKMDLLYEKLPMIRFDGEAFREKLQNISTTN